MYISRPAMIGLFCGSLFVVSAVGCSTMPTGTGGLLTAAGAPNSAPNSAPARGTAVVEIRDGGKNPKVMEMQLTESTHVQDALVHSKALRKFRRVNASVIRTSPEGRRHKMDCQFDVAGRRIEPEFDYALQPGDYVVIGKDTTSMADDMLKSIAGPLGRMTSR